MALIHGTEVPIMQRVHTVETWKRKKSYKYCHSRCRSQSLGVSVPLKWTIYQLVNNFQTIGYLLKKKQEWT